MHIPKPRLVRGAAKSRKIDRSLQSDGGQLADAAAVEGVAVADTRTFGRADALAVHRVVFARAAGRAGRVVFGGAFPNQMPVAANDNLRA